MATTAQRLLLERNDKTMIEPLMKLLETTKARTRRSWRRGCWSGREN